MKNRNRKKQRVFFVCAVLILVLLGGAFFLYRFVRFNLWISKDAGLLQSYPRILIQEGLDISDTNPISDRQARLIEKTIIRTNTKDRIVLHLSRSDIRYNPFRTKSYVKVFLQTTLPGDRTKTTSIKFLNVLVRRNDSWRVRSTHDISIE